MCNFSYTGEFNRSSEIKKEDDDHDVYYDKFSGYFFRSIAKSKTEKDGKYDRRTFPTIKEDASLNSRIDTALQISEI